MQEASVYLPWLYLSQQLGILQGAQNGNGILLESVCSTQQEHPGLWVLHLKCFSSVWKLNPAALDWCWTLWGFSLAKSGGTMMVSFSQPAKFSLLTSSAKGWFCSGSWEMFGMCLSESYNSSVLSDHWSVSYIWEKGETSRVIPACSPWYWATP